MELLNYMALVKYNNNSISDITAAPNVGSGDMTLIKTLTASGSSTLSFVHGSSDVVFDGTYPVYLFKFINIHPSGNNRFQFNASIDGGSNYNVSKTTTVWIAANREQGDDATLTKQNSDDLSVSTSFQDLMAYGNQGSDSDHNLNGTMHFFSPSNTTFWKNFIARTVHTGQSDYAVHNFVTGHFRDNDDDINAVRFQMNSGTFDGTIKLYGLKDS